MDKLLAQVRRAHRRLLVERFLRHLVWSVFAGLALAAVAIAVPQIVAIENLPANWTALWLSVGCIGGVLAAIVATWLTKPSPLDAAMEIDHRYALRERVASSLALGSDDLQSEAGQALLHDAARRVDRIDIAEKFRPRVDRRAWLPLVPAMLVFGLVMFGSNREAVSSVDPPPTVATKAQVKKANEELQKKLAEMQKKAEKKDLKGAEEVFKQLEEQTNALNKDELTDRKKATVKLNNLAKQLEERRASWGVPKSCKNRWTR